MKKSPSPRLPRSLSAQGQEPAGQAIWTGTVSFSLVAIPVRLVRAVEPGRVSFRLLHRKDYSPLLRRMVCPEDGKVVPPDQIVRGYEVGPDKYLLVTDEELESLSPERSRTIEIVEFVDRKEVGSVYYQHPYYLVPEKGGEKAYRLLAKVMQQTGTAGLAKFVLGEREYLVAVESRQGTLVLITLHYSEDILSAEGSGPAEEAVAPKEKTRLLKRIGEMTADFDPERYADERRQRIVKLLKKKLKVQPLVSAPAVEGEEGEGPVDLVAALEESMRQVKRGR